MAFHFLYTVNGFPFMVNDFTYMVLPIQGWFGSNDIARDISLSFSCAKNTEILIFLFRVSLHDGNKVVLLLKLYLDSNLLLKVLWE